MNCLPVCAVALVLPAAVIRAQAPFPVEDQIAVQLPAASGGTFVASMVARLGDDTTPDCLVLRRQNGRLDVCYMPGPAECSMLVPVATDVRDACVLREAGPDQRDALLVLDATGLRWFECGTAAQMPTEVLERFDATWSTFDRIWSGSEDGSSVWIFGSSPTVAEIRRAKWSDGWGDEPGLVVPPGATEVLTLDWNGVGSNEVVVRYGSQVYLLDWTGTAFDYFEFPTPPTGGHSLLGVLPASGGQPDLLAMFGYMPAIPGGPPGGYSLLVQRQGIAWMLGYGATAAASMTAADVTGDGLVDLVLGDAANSLLHLVKRQAPQTGGFVPPVVLGGTHALVAGQDRQNGSVDALCATDFDGDGDADLVGLQSANRLHHFVAGGVSPHRRLPQVSVERVDLSNDATSFQMTLNGQLPPGWSTALSANESAAVQVRVWLQTAPEAFIEQVARVGGHRVDVQPSATSVRTVVPVTRDGAALANAAFWIYTRIVVTGPNGTRRLPATLLHYTTNSLVFASRALEVSADQTGVSSSEDGGDGNTLGGGVVTRDPGLPPIGIEPPSGPGGG